MLFNIFYDRCFQCEPKLDTASHHSPAAYPLEWRLVYYVHAGLKGEVEDNGSGSWVFYDTERTGRYGYWVRSEYCGPCKGDSDTLRVKAGTPIYPESKPPWG